MNINRNVNCNLNGNRWNMKILARRWRHLCMYSTSCVHLNKCVQGRNNWISIVETNRSLRYVRSRWLLCRNTSQICILDFHLLFTPPVDMNINRNVNCNLNGNRWNMKILARRWRHLCMYSTSCVHLNKCVQGRNNWISIVETNRSLRYVRSRWLLCRNLGKGRDFVSVVAPQSENCCTPWSEMMITLDWI